MKVLGFWTVPLAQIPLDPDLLRRARKSRVVPAIAEDIPAVGILEPPILRNVGDGPIVDGPFVLLAGMKRLAAAREAGLEDVECKLVECSDDEAGLITGAENAHRDHDLKKRDAVSVQMVELRKKVLEELSGKPVPKSKARESIAKDRGIKPDSVKRAEQRSKKKPQKPTPAPVAQKPEDDSPERPPFDARGVDLNADSMAYIEGLRSALIRLSGLAGEGAGVMEQIEGFQSPRLDDLKGVRGMLEQLAITATGLTPNALCSRCLGQGCPDCLETGWEP